MHAVGRLEGGTVRFAGGQVHGTAGQSLPTGFPAPRECFGAKKLLSARFSCRTPMFLLQRSCSCRRSSFNEIVYTKINI